LAVFFPVRFGLIELQGGVALVSDILASLGVGVIAGLMAFGFFGARAGQIVGALVALVTIPFGIGFLHTYPVLTASLLAYAISAILCAGLSFNNTRLFDFSTIKKVAGSFDDRPKTV